MLKTLKDLFDSLTQPASSPQDTAHAVQLAAAVLLVEVARADASATPVEQEALLAALQRKFRLAPDEQAVCFVSIGTAQATPRRARGPAHTFLSDWQPPPV